MRYVLGVAGIFALLVLLVIVMEPVAHVMNFIDVPSLLPFILIMAAVIFMTGEYKTYTKSVNAILSKDYKISHADKEKAIRLYRLLGKTVVYTTVLNLTIGLGIMLGQFESVQFLGPMLSVAMVSVVYGTTINLVFIYPAIHILKNRENSETVRVISEKLVVDKLLELCYKKGITPEEILDAEDISLGGKNNGNLF